MTNKSLNILELSSLISKNKLFLALISLALSSLLAFYSLSIQDIYSSKSLLYSKNNSNKGGMNTSSYSGIANLAGIDLSNANNTALISLSIETMKSKDFFQFLVNNDEDFLKLLVAVKSYNKESETVEIDDSIFKDNVFINKDKNFFINSYRSYLSSFSTELDKNTNHVRLSTTHSSPIIAKYLLDKYKKGINIYIRDKKLEDAKKAIIFYKKELAATRNPILSENISQRILSELQTEFLAGASDDFVFTYIDSPSVNYKKIGPPRAIITIFGFIIGFIIGLVWILFKRAKNIYS
jgi:LPS O-antigen subunit length determinant protein (WzzB/FepE family)